MTVARKEALADGVEIWLGDCRDVLPLIGRVDAVVTDPPYGIGFKYESHVDDPDEYPALMRDVVQLIGPLLGERPAVFWQGMPNADRWHEWFPKGFRLFAACKGFVQYRPIGIQFSWDPIIFWGRPAVSCSVDRKDWHVQRIAPFGIGRQKIDHPCPRPYEQVEYIVETFTDDCQLVLDPFMGSGTTGVACVNLGRSFIGIEIEPKYFDLARRRLSEALAQPRLPFDEPVRIKQESLFEAAA